LHTHSSVGEEASSSRGRRAGDRPVALLPKPWETRTVDVTRPFGRMQAALGRRAVGRNSGDRREEASSSSTIRCLAG